MKILLVILLFFILPIIIVNYQFKAVNNTTKTNIKQIEKKSNKIVHHNFIIKSGYTITKYFNQIGISSRLQKKILNLGYEANYLKYLNVGQKIQIILKDKELYKLSYRIDLLNELQIVKKNNSFTLNKIVIKPKVLIVAKQITIKDSFYKQAVKKKLSNNLIQNTVNILTNYINFNHIKKGDRIRLLYKKFIVDKKVAKTEIIFLEFTNNSSKNIRLFLYTKKNHKNRYYDEKGFILTREFLKNPLNFINVKSKFNMNRYHPILKKVIPHKGVDYGSSFGSPVFATSNGIIKSATQVDSFGKFVYINHSNNYKTIYAHLSKFANNIKKGTKIKQGQVIGYTGNTGLSSGVHLHYEIREKGKAIDPMVLKSKIIRLRLDKKDLKKYLSQIVIPTVKLVDLYFKE